MPLSLPLSQAPGLGAEWNRMEKPPCKESERFLMPSPGGEGAQCAHWADEVEILFFDGSFCFFPVFTCHLISRLRRQLPLKGKPLAGRIHWCSI